MKAQYLVIALAASAPLAGAQTLIAADTGRVSPTTPGSQDHFGEHVAISGDWAISGARFDSGPGSATGTAYVFRWDGANWSQFQELVPADLSPNQYFGTSVDIEGDLAVVGSNNYSGHAHVFVYDAQSDQWIEQQDLTPTTAGGYFGIGVGISEDYVVVGEPYEDGTTTDSGSISIFQRDRNATPGDPTDDSWTFLEKHFALPQQLRGRLGEQISMEGDTFVVGAPRDDAPSADSGAAYVYERSGG